MIERYRSILLAAVLAGTVSGGIRAADGTAASGGGAPAASGVKQPLPSRDRPTPAAVPAPAVRNIPAAGKSPVPAAELPRSGTKLPAAAAAPQPTVIEYRVPCLTVRGDETHGKISYLPMKFVRSQTDKPLRVMIVDDTPNGSGQTIHSSVWLAALTAAMLRNDTMHGVTISVEFSGSVDGPSAGGVTCLAILSAMDGLPLPKDFAMTGTILPDGTIGVVGGVPEKMRAAAKSGVKRIFIPAFLRMFKNAKGEDVDLSRLADELKVELHRVENISEAYAILHNKPYQEGTYVNVRNMTKLSREVEDVLLPTYQDLSRKVAEKLKARPKLEPNRVIGDYVLSPKLAQDYYQEGKYLPATLQIFRTWQAWQAWEKTEAFLAKFYKEKNPDWRQIRYLGEYHLRKLIFAFREEMDKEEKTLSEAKNKSELEYLRKHYPDGEKRHGYFPFVDGLSEITAQLEPVGREPMLSGWRHFLNMNRATAGKANTASEKELKTYWGAEVDAMAVLFLATANEDALCDFMRRLGKALPEKHANKRAAEVERLFYSAACAADTVAGENFRLTFGAAADRDRRNAVETEIRNNPVISSTFEMRNHALECHGMLLPDAEEKATHPAYHLQASLKAQISSFVLASAIMVMYGENQSSDFMAHLLRNARGAAVRNINDCVKAGIPCLSAICDFEIAEASSKNRTDNISGLVMYWRASLYSKALLMSFN